MQEDIREKQYIDTWAIQGLNFINPRGEYVFRHFHRQGLRSRIVGILRSEDVKMETQGVLQNGIFTFPTARPIKILRIYRGRFSSLQVPFQSIRRVQTLERYLGEVNCALSTEFLVSYKHAGIYKCLWCGLQEYIHGLGLDPWGFFDLSTLVEYCQKSAPGEDSVLMPQQEGMYTRIRTRAQNFVDKIKLLIGKTGLVPDLAGGNNLILTPGGDLKLVDINNITQIPSDSRIPVDDYGYPVTDKSIEALSRLEAKILNRFPDSREDIYSRFLDKQRMQEVSALEKQFYENLGDF